MYFIDMKLLKRLSFDMQTGYKPRASSFNGGLDVKMQAGSRRQTNKYFGPSDIVSGKELLIYRARRINDYLQQAVFQICDLPRAIEHCEKMDAKQRWKDDNLIREWAEKRKREVKPDGKESK